MEHVGARASAGARRAGPVAVRRLVAAAAAVVVALVALAPGRAEAQAGYGVPPASNLRTTILGVSMPVAGVEASSVDLGDQLELRGTPAAALVVLGYQDEPFVRTAPDGVYVNARSPSLSGDPDHGPLVRDPDPAAPAEWVAVGAPGLVRWHDHRAHWMGVDDPPAAAERPDEEHVIVERWVVPLVAGEQRGEITGDLRWVPPPPPLPWLALAVAAMVAVLVPALRGAPARSVLVASSVLAVSAGVVVVGWIAVGGATVGQVVAVAVPAVAGLVLLVVLGGWIRPPGRRVARLGLGAVAAAALVVPVAPLVLSAPFGSQLASVWATGLVRGAAALVLGSSVGLVVALLVPDGGRAPQARGRAPHARGGRGRVKRPPLAARAGRPSARRSAVGLERRRAATARCGRSSP